MFPVFQFHRRKHLRGKVSDCGSLDRPRYYSPSRRLGGKGRQERILAAAADNVNSVVLFARKPFKFGNASRV